jgi:ABC-type Fe3+-siderophore transport system permease subunit
MGTPGVQAHALITAGLPMLQAAAPQALRTPEAWFWCVTSAVMGPMSRLWGVPLWFVIRTVWRAFCVRWLHWLGSL